MWATFAKVRRSQGAFGEDLESFGHDNELVVTCDWNAVSWKSFPRVLGGMRTCNKREELVVWTPHGSLDTRIDRADILPLLSISAPVSSIETFSRPYPLFQPDLV